MSAVTAAAIGALVCIALLGIAYAAWWLARTLSSISASLRSLQASLGTLNESLGGYTAQAVLLNEGTKSIVGALPVLVSQTSDLASAVREFHKIAVVNASGGGDSMVFEPEEARPEDILRSRAASPSALDDNETVADLLRGVRG